MAMRTDRRRRKRGLLLGALALAVLACAGWLIPGLLDDTKDVTDSGLTNAASQNGPSAQQEAAPRFAPVSAAAISRLRRSITSELRTLPSSSKFSIVVSDCERGQILYQQNPETALVPASNMKLFTGAAALSILGPDYQFETRFLANGTYSDGVLHGDLVVVGSGDPTISKRFLDTNDPMMPMVGLARLLKNAGLSAIEGDVIGWTGAFGGPPKPARWPKDPLWKRWMVEVTPLVFNDNQVNIRSFISGGRPRTEAIPNIGHVTLTNRLTLCNSAKSMAVSFQRPATSSHFTVTGRLYKNSAGYTQEANVHDGSLYFTRALHRAIQSAGIEVKGKPRTSHLPSRQSLAPLDEIYTYRSSLMNSLPIMLQQSQNLYAELILRALAGSAHKEGVSFNTGTQTLTTWLRSHKILHPQTHLADGSGLSRANQISALQITSLLNFISRDPSLFHLYRTSLAQPAATGTLRKRMPTLHSRLFAKTGTLNSIKALSGYIQTPTSRWLSFSLLFNNTNTSLARRLQDRLSSHIAQTSP